MIISFELINNRRVQQINVELLFFKVLMNTCSLSEYYIFNTLLSSLTLDPFSSKTTL